MANLRIKDITTTASSTASGEYLAIDGLANGTRKLSATAPTFAGAVTATGGFVGALTGNADTVTTNANLTGTVTSTGNTTAIANGAISNAMLANAAVANLSGTNTGDNTVATSGAATTAETLLTARNINGVAFDGSAAITINAVDATARLASSAVSAYGLTLVDDADAATARTTLGLGTLATQSGTFSGTSSGANTGDQTTITGNAGTATALATSRTIGGSSFDGSANVTSFPAPGAIGGTTPSTGAFTTLSASGEVTITAAGGVLNFSGASFGHIKSTGDIYVNPALTKTLVLGADNQVTIGTSGFAVTGKVTASNGVTSTGARIESTLTYGPMYYSNENNTDNVNRSSFTFARGASTVGQIVTNNTSTAYNTSSDYRLKTITGAVANSGALIDALLPKVGTWKSGGTPFTGFLAHEFADVFPLSVTGEKDAEDEDGNPIHQSMQASSSEVIAVLVAELQDVRARLTSLEA